MKTFIKVSSLLLVVICLAAFCGCEKLGTEFSELMIIQGIGIDKTQNGYKATVEILNNEQNGSPGGEISSDVTRIYSAEGKTVAEAVFNVTAQSGNTPFFAHNRVIIFGESVLADGIAGVLDFFGRDFNSRPSQLICTAKGCSAHDIINAKFPRGDVRCEIIEDILIEAYETSRMMRVRIIDAENKISDETSALCIPAIVLINNGTYDVCSLDGCAVISNGGAFSGYIDNEMASGIMLLNGKIRGGEFSAVLPGGENASFLIVKGKTTYKIEDNGNFPVFKAEVSISCDIDSVEENPHFKDEDEFIETLRVSAEKALLQKLENTVTFLSNENTDVSLYGIRILCKSRELYDVVKDDWSEVFPKIKTEINVRVTVRRIGEKTFNIKSR